MSNRQGKSLPIIFVLDVFRQSKTDYDNLFGHNRSDTVYARCYNIFV